MKLQVRQSKKENPITISWTAVKGFTGYEVYAAKKDGKKKLPMRIMFFSARQRGVTMK